MKRELLIEVSDDDGVREVDYATLEDVKAWLNEKGLVVEILDAPKTESEQRSESTS